MLAATLAALSLAVASPTASNLPKQGILAPGKSLAGVSLGATKAEVRKRWGGNFRICTVCALPTWLYTYRGSAPVGAAVSFRNGRAAAVFTLGAPLGWRTTEGLVVGGLIDDVDALYGQGLAWRRCIGYGAVSMRKGAVVTSIYTAGDVVYGFALTRPSEPVCQ